MGVPKFYRWISERYPCLSEVIKEHEVPDFDNLYLDMNGIIHICSHPNDNDPHFRMTEEQMFKDIFHYIDALFRIVKPKEVFFLAVDGVAPRAKMNQQRGRRFRSIREAETNIKKAIARGEILPEEKRFDHNCITPGTKFMIRLQRQLEYFVQEKITTDDSWKNLRVYLSGHETPGEGEHKIMEFIRYERSQDGYDPNTRHCLYGLDADLMMLGLCSHEPHFSLLREEVRFGKKNQVNRPSRVEDTNFHLLHLSLMREYIDHEFEELKPILPFEYNLESIIDDWVLMGFLVGNDFVPHLPNLHIAHNSLPFLYQAYIRTLPKIGGYINEGGTINLSRFQIYLDEISVSDLSKFEENYSDFRWLESKRNDRVADCDEGVVLPGLKDSSRIQHSKSSLQAVKELARRQGMLSAESSDNESADYQDDEAFQSEFLHNKRAYYCDKLKLQGTDGDIASVCKEYIRAMQWICHYYYNGVQSWSWFYPFHYAPYMSDLRDIVEIDMSFNYSKPFLPYEQLLAVLPPGSRECIPDVYWDLMCSELSPIIEYYPEEFECDLNGKQQEWEAVVCIPFIEEVRLLAAMVVPNSKLNTDDRRNNTHSDCQLYQHQDGLSFVLDSFLPAVFPNVHNCSAKKTLVPINSWVSTDVSVFKKGLLKGTKLSTYFPGFPTMYHIKHSATLMKQGVKVFSMPSRSTNMILTIDRSGDDARTNFNYVSSTLLGKSVHVRWPHFKEAKIVAVSDGTHKHELYEDFEKTYVRKLKLNEKENSKFCSEISELKEKCLLSKGIDIGETNILAYVKLCLGRHYKFEPANAEQQGILVKEWASNILPFPYQAIVQNLPVEDNIEAKEQLSIMEYFPIGSTVYKTTPPNYGSKGTVIGVTNNAVKILFKVRDELNLQSVKDKQHSLSKKYYFGYQLSSRLGISGFLVSRITGNLSVQHPPGYWPLGLRVKLRDSGLQGYTKLDKEYRYSSKVENLLLEYMERFPEVFTYLENNSGQFDACEMFQMDNPVPKLEELKRWLESLNMKKVATMHKNSESLDAAVVDAIDQELKNKEETKSMSEVTLEVRPSMLYKPQLRNTIVPDDSVTTTLLDRVVIVREAYTVPLDMHGTVIGVINNDQDTMYEVMFDEPFISGNNLSGKCPELRGYTVPACMFLNLTKGQRDMTRSLYAPSNVTVYHLNRQSKDEFNNRKKNVGQFKPHVKSAFNRFNTPKLSPSHQANSRDVFLHQQNPRMKGLPVQKSENIFESTWGALQSQNNSARNPNNGPQVTKTQHKENKKIIKNNETKIFENSTTAKNSSLSKAAQKLPVVAENHENQLQEKDAIQTDIIQHNAGEEESVDLAVLNNLFQSAKIQKSPLKPPSTTTFAGQSVSLCDLFKSAQQHKEGKNELNELLQREQEDEIKWSTVDDPLEEEDEKQFEKEHRNGTDHQSTRSSSVEDNQKMSNVDLLVAECRKHQMMPPIYSYFNTPEKLTVTSLQLMNGVRFSSPALPTKEKSMENAAQTALNYMKQIPSVAPQAYPENLGYLRQPMFLNNAAFPQYGIPHIRPPHPMMIAPHGPFHPAAYHPSVVPQYGFHPPMTPIHQANMHGYFPPRPVTYNQNTTQYPASYVLQNNTAFMQRSPSKSTAFVPLQVARQQVLTPVSPTLKTKVTPNDVMLSAESVEETLVDTTTAFPLQNSNILSPMKKPLKAKLAASFMNSN